MKNKSQEKIILSTEIRNLVGKKAKKLRKQGLILANIFGQDFKSQAITVNYKDFLKVYKIAKETGIIYLQLKNQELPVLIKNIQKHPITDQIIHVDFRKIDLNKKIKTEVPIKIIGESEAVTQKGGVLLIQSDHLLVEALPENIPQEIEVDISIIKDIGQEIKAVDLPKSDKYEIKTPLEKVLVSVIAHKEESAAPETTTVTPELVEKEKPEEEKEEQKSESGKQTTDSSQKQ